MKQFRTFPAHAALLAIAAASWLHAADIKVVTSGAFTAAYLELAPQYEHATGDKLLTEFGASTGTTPDTIPNRLLRGESIDVVIMSAPSLEELVRQGKITVDSRVDLVRSDIVMAVKAGAPHPDIHSVDALKQTLLHARSIAYSGSASGVYLSTELFPRLDPGGEIAKKSRRIEGEPVGNVVARGDAEIGFQQRSEMLPVKGIDIVAPLPEGAQRVTIFAAAIPVTAKQPQAARHLIEWLASPATRDVIIRTGLEPVKRKAAAN